MKSENKIRNAIKNGIIKIEKVLIKRNSKDTIKINYYKKCKRCGKLILYSSFNSLRTAFYRNPIPPCRKCFDKIRLSEESRKKLSEKLKLLPPFSKERIQNIKIGQRKSRIFRGLPEYAPKKVRMTIEEAIENSRRKQKGIPKPINVRLKMSLSAHKRNRFPMSEETKRKIRIKKLERLQKIFGKINPRSNPNACKIIDEYGKKNGYKFQHAENGGEFFIRDLGYWVDGYDKKNNTILEIDEKHHFNVSGDLKEKDKNRMNEIIQHLGCKFIRIKDDGIVYLIKEGV